MADVGADNQREAGVPPPPSMGFEHKKEIKIAAHDVVSSSATSETSSDNQLTHDEVSEHDVDEPHGGDVDIDEEDVERRLTWIGEGLLDGDGLEAVQQLMNLPPSPQKRIAEEDEAASSVDEQPSNDAEPEPTRVERSGSKLLDFLAKEEGCKPNETPMVAPVRPPSRAPAPTTPVATSAEEEKRQNKLLDFLATDIGERYLDGLYQEDDSGDNRHTNRVPAAATESKAAAVQNNRLKAFLAKERGERVHNVEKIDVDSDARRPEPYRVSISIVTPETAADALASDAVDRADSAEPKPDTAVAACREDDAAAKSSPVPQPAERNKLVDFVKNVQPPARPKFVLFNPADLVSSSSSSGSETEETSPTANPKDFRLKKRSQDPNRVRFANPGLDIQTGVVRQAVTDHYGREELLDFIAEVDVSAALPRSQRSASPPQPARRESPSPLPQRQQSPPQRQESSPPRRESPPLRKDSPPPPTTTTAMHKPEGRLAHFLRKFSSKSDKSKNGCESGGSRNGSRSISPELSSRHSAPPPSHPPQPPEAQYAPFKPAPFVARTSVESDPGVSTPVEEKLMSRPSFGQMGAESDPSSKRMVLLGSLRQLLEDCEKNALSDISMVRISILLSTVNQIVRDDLRKERPAQGIMRRVSMHIPGAQTDGAVKASWVRSNKEQEEYERGHTTTTSDIAHHVEKKSQSPERVPSPVLSLQRVDEPIADDAMAAFTAFETAQNMVEVIAAFDKLLGSCGISEAAARTPLRVYNHVKSALYSQFSFRQKQLFRLLDAKLSVDVYKRQPCLHKRVCVVGAGPVGLRAAVELALLGSQVVVIDKRKMFNRENILHMWPWVVQDLTSLGAKVFFPQFCHSSAYFHVGTRQLQCILLKVALLLGAKMHPGTSFEGLASPDSIVSERKSYYTVVTKPQIPWQEFTAVLGACGTKDKLGAHAAIKRFVFSRKEAIGLVCYFPNLGTNEEKKVNEFSWTIQFKQRMFAKMRDIGIDLENVVYYRGEYHYIVMTPKRNNLLQQGVLKINYPSVSDLVAVDNIDPGALNDYVSRIINFFEIPQKSEFARVRLFDFSTRTRAAQAANVLSSRRKKLYVGLIGDALMEPFWPEGLGTCRGFLSAMDACWMVSQIGKQSDEQILADRELGYRIVQHISGFQREDLQKNVRKYNVDPSSRYTVQYPATITY